MRIRTFWMSALLTEKAAAEARRVAKRVNFILILSVEADKDIMISQPETKVST